MKSLTILFSMLFPISIFAFNFQTQITDKKFVYEKSYSIAETTQHRIVNGYIFNTNTGKYVFFKKAAVTVDYYGIHVVVDGLNQVFEAVRTTNNRDFNYTVWVNLGPYGGYWLYFNL